MNRLKGKAKKAAAKETIEKRALLRMIPIKDRKGRRMLDMPQR